jgi:HEAT repeat protein
MGPAAVGSLIEALGDKEVTVRKYAAIVLGRICDPRAIDELGMTIYDLHHEVGKAAAEALAKFGAPAVDIFIEALSHPEAAVRENSLVALSKIQDARVAPILIEMLGDSVRDVQKQALLAIGALRDARAIPALEDIIANRADREMSTLAKQILESIK